MSIPRALFTGGWLTPSPRTKRPSVASAMSAAPRAGVRMAHIDVGDPGADLDAPGRRAHELRGRHDVVVDLGREERVEACLLGLAGDRLDFVSAPADTGNDG